MKHEEWIKGIEEGLTPTVAAKTAGLSHTTVIRQLNRGGLSAESVISIARAYEVSIVDALVETGWIKSHEVKIIGVKAALKYATNKDMYDEMMDRVDPDATGKVDKEAVELFHGDEDDITPSFPDNVTQFPTAPTVDPIDDDELAEAIREANSHPQAAHPADDTEYVEPEFP